MAISSLLFLTVGSLAIYSGRSLTGLSNYAALEAQSRSCLDQMTKEIRQSLELVDYSPTSITLRDADNKQLQYTYDAGARTLTRSKDGQPTVLLEECDVFNFSFFQRNITNGTFSQYPASGTNTCKLIELNWSCSRSILGTKQNTETIQSAKVVIRKKRDESILHTLIE